ncbi:hypothetical protein [Alkanindiges illinoisensis]|uniref:hypothetical protein n=1 Tax=Alkanindiges illinoisensis TaxID=197183 RepID=UPI00068557F8|nr:hypothetical protein [Alkanindiges illinoisensis]
MTIYCPRCQSSNLALIQQAQPINQPDYSDSSIVLKSMAGLATLGVTIARQTSIATPLAGGIAGAVLGCLFGNAAASQPAYPPRTDIRYTLCCQDCQHVFSPSGS